MKDVYGAVVQADRSKVLVDCDALVGAYDSAIMAEELVAFGNMYTKIQLNCTSME